MTKPATIDMMAELHKATAVLLLERIQSGEAGAAEINAAIKFLKDNNIEARGDRNPEIQSLAEQFPSFADVDE